MRAQPREHLGTVFLGGEGGRGQMTRALGREERTRSNSAGPCGCHTGNGEGVPGAGAEAAAPVQRHEGLGAPAVLRRPRPQGSWGVGCGAWRRAPEDARACGSACARVTPGRAQQTAESGGRAPLLPTLAQVPDSQRAAVPPGHREGNRAGASELPLLLVPGPLPPFSSAPAVLLGDTLQQHRPPGPRLLQPRPVPPACAGRLVPQGLRTGLHSGGDEGRAEPDVCGSGPNVQASGRCPPCPCPAGQATGPTHWPSEGAGCSRTRVAWVSARGPTLPTGWLALWALPAGGSSSWGRPSGLPWTPGTPGSRVRGERAGRSLISPGPGPERPHRGHKGRKAPWEGAHLFAQPP